MKAIICDGIGGSEIMSLGETEKPEPRAGEIRIKISYAGVNRPDILQRAGAYPPPADASPILGLECAGIVDAIGEGATWSAGDQVFALLPGGGYAEYAVCDGRHALPIPKGVSMKEAAAMPEALFTVWTNVFDRAGLKAGENFLVHGGASGIGTTAVQMARAMGANVFATAGGVKKCEAVAAIGARAIDYQSEDFAEILRGEKLRMNVILDMVGGDYIAKNISVMATEGRLVNIAFLRGAKAEVNFMPVMLKRLKLMGSTLRSQSSDAKATIAEALRHEISPLIKTGEIRPIVDREFALADAAAAHDYLDSGAHIGKVVLRTG